MSETTVSSKFQVVIPKAIRERAKIKPGQKYTVLLKGRVISLVPDISLEDMFGMFPHLNPEGLRDEEDRA
jgi:AbrB family looped-hinge helix DNA binding protein